MLLVILMSIAIHSSYVGSKVLVSLYALDLGAIQITVGVLAALYASRHGVRATGAHDRLL